MSTALAPIERPAATLASLPAEGFDFSDLRVFTSIPRHGHDVAAMHGLVVVFDTECMGRDGIQPGGLYIRESQHTTSGMSWEYWLEREWKERARRCQPVCKLRTRREVVQAIEHPWGGPALRMATGGIDGPYYEWAFGADLIGKVVGIYAPRTAA